MNAAHRLVRRAAGRRSISGPGISKPLHRKGGAAKFGVQNCICYVQFDLLFSRLLFKWDYYGIIMSFQNERVISVPQIIPIKDLKDTSGVSELCHSLKEPIFITKNGYGDMVLMSMELFEEQRKKWEMYSDIELSEEQISQGKTKNAKEALVSVRAKYGL